MKDGLLTINEVSVLVGRSPHTINYWYLWKRDNSEHELATLLPEYIQDGRRQTRYWKSGDIWKLLEFKTKVPQGRGGIMKQSIHKYFHGGEDAREERTTGAIDSTICA